MKTKAKTYFWLPIAILFTTGCLIYSNTLNVPFYFDDVGNIVDSSSIRLQKISWSELHRAGFKSILSGRPVAYISFALNYYFGYYNVFGYHVVNILIHIANGILLYIFLSATLNLLTDQQEKQKCYLIAFLGALTWLVHPLHIQSVTYIVQRMNGLATLFYVLSLWLYVKARQTAHVGNKWLYGGGCFLAGALALGSKEIAATLPVIIVLYEVYFFQRLDLHRLKKKIIPILILTLIMVMIVFVYLGSNPISKIMSTYDHRDFTLYERLFTQLRVIFFYISLIFFPLPSRLNLLHDFHVSRSLFDPLSTFFALIGIVALIAGALIIGRKERFISFCILWFFINLAIESSVLGLEIIFEHRTYLPSMLVFAAMISLVFRIMTIRLWKPGVLITAICIVMGVWTYQRNQVWCDPIIFWEDTVKKSPRSARAMDMLGSAYMHNKQFTEAITRYQKAISLKPDDPTSYINLASVYMKQGDLDLALMTFRQSLEMAPGAYQIYNNLGNLYDQKGDSEIAIKMFMKSIEIEPDNPKAYHNLGSQYLKLNRTSEAIKALQRAIELAPGFADAYNNLGKALFKAGYAKPGLAAFKKALEIQPNHLDANYNLGKAYAMLGIYGKAISQYEKTIQLNPNDELAHHNAGILYLENFNHPEKTVQHLRKALMINPEYAYAPTARKIIAKIENQK